MAAHPPYRTGRLLLNGTVAGALAGSTASVVTAFELVSATLQDAWSGLVETAGTIFGIATPLGLFGGALYGLVVALLARPLARLQDRTLRHVIFVAAFTAGFAVLAIAALATGVPPWAPLGALVVVGFAIMYASLAFRGFDRLGDETSPTGER